MQKTLISIGIVIMVIGLCWPWLSKLPLGRLPGDILIERQNFRFYMPLASMLILSALLSLVLWLMRR